MGMGGPTARERSGPSSPPSGQGGRQFVPRDAALLQLERSPAWEARACRLAAEIDWEAGLPQRACSLRWRFGQMVKRCLDAVCALLGIVLLLPFGVLVAVVIRLDSPGPIFYRWRVMGYRGRPFTGWKLRTMTETADELKASLMHLNEMNGPVFKMQNDPRLTPLGPFLRKYSIDELPQLWSVLLGDMSLSGPRPPFPKEFVDFSPTQRLKLSVRPGLTCLWQVSGRSEIVDFEEWMRLDREYIENWSVKLDLLILLKTALVVLRGRGAY